MFLPRQTLFWVLGALGATTVLAGVLLWEHRDTRARYATFLAGDPHRGAELFDRKGCARCHSVGGNGGRIGPDLGFEMKPKSSINQLVGAMWNHAPQMWERMQSEKVRYPDLDQEDMAHLFAFLYTARYVDEPGDSVEGRRVFDSKGCARCHAVQGTGGTFAKDLGKLSGVDTPIVWTQAMWNHAPSMEAAMLKLGVRWPRFEGREMNDLLAFVRESSGGTRRESSMLPADIGRGRKLFKEKACAGCHSVQGERKQVGPELGPRPGVPSSIVEFAGRMWNHSPEMWRAMKTGGIARPVFEEKQMADLIAFLYGQRYLEVGGSVEEGAKAFLKRGCSQCHAGDASGTRLAPALRRPGQPYSMMSLAEALWRHGPKMYERTKEMSVPWPRLDENDVGDLIAFLNAQEGGR